MRPQNRPSPLGWALGCLGAGLLLAACQPGVRQADIQLRPALEDIGPDGALYTPETQSILRGEHWLEQVEGMDLAVTDGAEGTFVLQDPDRRHHLSLEGIPLDLLVPRLHYPPANPPDAFDAFNLMLAEFARNSLHVPFGRPEDAMAHFESDLDGAAPWTLAGDFRFDPNPFFRPLRFSVINNCLAPGLWELSALDRAGELYHAWFDMPLDLYYPLTAQTNDLPESFVVAALTWSTQPVAADLDRLRRIRQSLGAVPLAAVDGSAGFSTQDARRKLAKGLVKVERRGRLTTPLKLAHFRDHPAHMADFVPPGKYSASQRKRFDLSFLFAPRQAVLALVEPLTDYRWTRPREPVPSDAEYLEIRLVLEDVQLILGNLPLALLVQQEDFAIHGPGVGILPAAEPAERRALLLERGPRPSFAYLLEERGGQWMALNAHERGIEQVFLRCHPFAPRPYLRVIVTSFERIANLVEYRLPLPPALQERARAYSRAYISPLFATYRDDNLR